LGTWPEAASELQAPQATCGLFVRIRMTLWYDVTDIISWDRPHLTGIQRTVVGVMRGLRDQGIPFRLVAFHRSHGFREVESSDLPPLIRVMVDGPVAGTVGTTQPAVTTACRRPAEGRSRIPRLGDDDAGRELHRAMSGTVRAARQLSGASLHWLRVRIRGAVGGRPEPALPGPPPAPALADPSSPIAPGDEFVSIGATWSQPSHPVAVAGLRACGVRVVRMVYDLIPTLKPEWVDDPDGGVCPSRPITDWARQVIRDSDAVVTISEFSRREILRYCAESGLAHAPITVVRLGDDLGPLPEHPPIPRLAPARPFFLCVSTFDLRKNHRLLYDAWCVLAARGPGRCPDLVCVGMPHRFCADILREIRLNRDVNRHIHLLTECADEELAWYYRHCSATIYPSRYEGWGLPVAESLGHGRLVLASNATSIPEIGGPLPAYFDPLDVHGLVALVERTLADPQWVEAREQAIRSGFVATPWHRTALQVLEALRAACPRTESGDRA
jgi:glycosyltransferase involved in cell wall biosynthesis